MFSKIKNLFTKLFSSIKNHSSKNDRQMLIDAFINAGLEYNETIGKELRISKEEYNSIKDGYAAKIEELTNAFDANIKKTEEKYGQMRTNVESSFTQQN